MSAIAFLRQLLDDGLTLDAAMVAAERFEQRAAATEIARIAARREKDAARKQAQRGRERHAESRGQAVTGRDSRGPSPHVGERAQVVTPSLPSLRSEELIPPEKTTSSTPKGAETSRGTRLADQWRPDDLGMAYAAQQLGPNVDPERELDRFRDYWRSIPGAKARKLDWPGTWRNWVRNAADKLPRKAHERPNHDAKFEARQANHARALAGADSAAGRTWKP